MAVTYDATGPEVEKMLAEAMKVYHPDLEKYEVTVQPLFADKLNKDDEPIQALKVGGYPAVAKIRITSAEERAQGLRDAVLVIDRFSWDRMADTRRMAVLDHELEHLDFVCDKDAMPKRDDLNRPKLKLRHHDWRLEGFANVVERHGEASVEAEQFRWFETEYGQLCMFGPNGGKAVRDIAKKAHSEGATAP